MTEHNENEVAGHGTSEPQAQRESGAEVVEATLPTETTETTERVEIDEADTADAVRTESVHDSGWPIGTGPVPAVSHANASSPYRGSTAGTDLASPRPRVRVGAIVWGGLVVVFAILTIAITSSTSAKYSFDVWLASLTPGAWVVVGVVSLGVAVLLIAGTSAIRGAQRRAARR